MMKYCILFPRITIFIDKINFYVPIVRIYFTSASVNWQKDRLCDLLLRQETCILTVERRRFSCAASNEKEGYRTCVLLTKIFPNRN